MLLPLLLIVFFPYKTVAQVTYEPGDVNQDGVVSIADVSALINMLLNGTSGPSQPESGDIETITVNGVSFNMVYVASGTFEMGAPPRPITMLTTAALFIR